MTILSRIKESIRPSQPQVTSTTARIIPTPPGFNAARRDTFGKSKSEAPQPQLLDHLEEPHPYYNPNSTVQFKSSVTVHTAIEDEARGTLSHQNSFDREHHISYARAYSSTKRFLDVVVRRVRV